MNEITRRKFMSASAKAIGAGVLLPGTVDAAAATQRTWTVGQIMDVFIKEVPGAPFDQTVDTLKSGERDIKVTGIVTTMFATLAVIQKAIDLNANLIIAHEPTFYNHLDQTDWLANDDVYRHKAALLKEHNIAVWRNHDYIHRLPGDGVRMGVVSQLGWQKYASPDAQHVFNMQGRTLKDIIAEVKSKMDIPTIRFIGDLSEPTSKVLLMPGAAGGRNQIMSISRVKPDLVVCGEVAEWETAEYVRDARIKGDKLSLIVLGHVASEEAGSKFLADWLTKKVSGITTTHVPAGHSLLFG